MQASASITLRSCVKSNNFKGIKMKTRDEMIYEFMLASLASIQDKDLNQNNAQYVLKGAINLTDVYLAYIDGRVVWDAPADDDDYDALDKFNWVNK